MRRKEAFSKTYDSRLNIIYTYEFNYSESFEVCEWLKSTGDIVHHGEPIVLITTVADQNIINRFIYSNNEGKITKTYDFETVGLRCDEGTSEYFLYKLLATIEPIDDLIIDGYFKDTPENYVYPIRTPIGGFIDYKELIVRGKNGSIFHFGKPSKECFPMPRYTILHTFFKMGEIVRSGDIICNCYGSVHRRKILEWEEEKENVEEIKTLQEEIWEKKSELKDIGDLRKRERRDLAKKKRNIIDSAQEEAKSILDKARYELKKEYSKY